MKRDSIKTIRDALQRLTLAAGGEQTPQVFSIPVNEADADQVLDRAIDELARLREGIDRALTAFKGPELPETRADAMAYNLLGAIGQLDEEESQS